VRALARPWCGSKAAIAVFSRAGEASRVARCRHRGRIISGITAGLAAAASLQIPLTHRDIS
jgi:siroheme synthase